MVWCVPRSRFRLPLLVVEIFDLEELNMLNKGHWRGLTYCKLGCRLDCHLS